MKVDVVVLLNALVVACSLLSSNHRCLLFFTVTQFGKHLSRAQFVLLPDPASIVAALAEFCVVLFYAFAKYNISGTKRLTNLSVFQLFFSFGISGTTRFTNFSFFSNAQVKW